MATAQQEPKTTRVADPELQALEKIGKLLADFPDDIRQRMVNYMIQKYMPTPKVMSRDPLTGTHRGD